MMVACGKNWLSFKKSACFQLVSQKKHSDSNEIDFQWTVHWLIQTVKILEKNNEVSQFYAHLTFNHGSAFFLLKKMSHCLRTCSY